MITFIENKSGLEHFDNSCLYAKPLMGLVESRGVSSYVGGWWWELTLVILNTSRVNFGSPQRVNVLMDLSVEDNRTNVSTFRGVLGHFIFEHLVL